MTPREMRAAFEKPRLQYTADAWKTHVGVALAAGKHVTIRPARSVEKYRSK